MMTHPDARLEAVLRECAAELVEFFCPANPPYRSKEAMAQDMTLVLARHFRAALSALASTEAGFVRVPVETLEWIKAKTADKRNPAVAFVCDKLLRGEPFSVLREDEDAAEQS